MRRLLSVAILILAACGGGDSGGGGGGGSGGPAEDPGRSEIPAPEPVVALNVQPAGALDLLPVVESLRVAHVRTSWWEWSTPQDWAFANAYAEAGVDILPLVYGGPERLLALRTGVGSFPFYQVGNEPDGRTPSQPRPTFDEGRAVAMDLLRFRDVAGAGKIVSPGLAWNRDGVTDFLRGMLSVPGAFDVLAIHVYGVSVWGEPLSRHQAVRAAGWDGPIWITEIGVSDAEAAFAGEPPDGWQLRNWRAMYAEDANRIAYARIYGFQLTADPDGWGLLRENGTLRPAGEWLRDRP